MERGREGTPAGRVALVSLPHAVLGLSPLLIDIWSAFLSSSLTYLNRPHPWFDFSLFCLSHPLHANQLCPPPSLPPVNLPFTFQPPAFATVPPGPSQSFLAAEIERRVPSTPFGVLCGSPGRWKLLECVFSTFQSTQSGRMSPCTMRRSVLRSVIVISYCQTLRRNGGLIIDKVAMKLSLKSFHTWRWGKGGL